jgi:DNA-binding transcriptional ArsR family regulator
MSTQPVVSYDRAVPHPRREDLHLGDLLQALADPLRLRIVCTLAESGTELSCSAFELPVTKSTSTHHFRVLREAGIIHQRYEGTARLNELRREDLEATFPGLLDSILRAARGDSADSECDG